MSVSPYRQAVDAFLAAHCPTRIGGVCLDVGGGTTRGRWQRDGTVDRWAVLDCVEAAVGPDETFRLGRVEEAIPWADGMFHLVKATDVLYLLCEMDLTRALEEIRRVLRPTGLFIATLPFLRPASEPEDWGRWTPHALEELLLDAGFPRSRIVALGGRWSLLVQLLYDATYHGQPVRRRLVEALTPWALRRDRAHPSRWALGYGVVAWPSER